MPTRRRLAVLALLPMLASLSACDVSVSPPGPRLVTGHVPPTDMRSDYLALGDSYTIGQGVAVDARFPNRLADALRAEGIDVGQPTIVARTGWTTGDLLAALDLDASLGGRDAFALVTLLIGVNNQYRGQYSGLSIDVYADELRRLLDRAVELARGEASRVVVVSIPDYGVTPFASTADPAAIAQEIDAFNAVNRQLAHDAGVRYVGITDLSRRGRDQPDLHAPDGLHPSATQYALWVERLLTPSREALGR